MTTGEQIGDTLDTDTIGRVRRAVEDALKPGCVLRTPDRSKGQDFRVMSIDSTGIKVHKLRSTSITWEELGGAVDYLRSRGRGYELEVGARQQSDVSGDTLEGCLRRISGGRTMKSSYVASILGATGIVEVYGGLPNSVTLSPDWRGSPAQ